MFAPMDELQLRMTVYDVGLVADAIERDMNTRPPEKTTPDLGRILAWLRYRIARRELATTTTDQT